MSDRLAFVVLVYKSVLSNRQCCMSVICDLCMENVYTTLLTVLLQGFLMNLLYSLH